ncbi:MAG TPA: tRNA preQ1(34) S-adenosylmethionine ribosyltransferase-isomerase QueA [Woeseiaceae bacterium]|nr:tRNA preQ1(34) S-adenosylmethionine ribosyltransferase-isomerase QueA [Woeseiaceae bacterium]
MQASDFDYELPPELIAKYPAAERRGSRLMIVDTSVDNLLDRRFEDLPEFLRPGDLLVFNDTRVMKARLCGQKTSGGRVEILLERILSPREATAKVRASKRPRPGSRIHLQDDIEVEVTGRDGEFFCLEFSQPVAEVLDAIGEVPLPPYLERPAELLDRERYQTVYARERGAVAAPTAGLHFDEALLQQTLDAGVHHAFVTLHVGAGTFQNLRQEEILANRLHAERVQVPPETCEAVARTRSGGGRVFAVGTTSVRALESASADGELRPFDGETEMFILPGYSFRSVDALLTNFHLPRSSLLMLVAAFAGTDRILSAYRHAVAERYRFFSYGDAMLVLPGVATCATTL